MANRWAQRVAAPATRWRLQPSLDGAGRLVCTPHALCCDRCPLSTRCVANELGEQEQIPARAGAVATELVREAAVVIRRGDHVVIEQRPAGGRWANLWEFPHGPLADGETSEAAAARIGLNLTGLGVLVGPELLTLRHGVTRYLITLACFEADYQVGEFSSHFYVQARGWFRTS